MTGWSDVVAAGTWGCWLVLGVTWGLGALRGRDRRAAPTSHEGRDTASRVGLVVGLALALSPASWWRPLSLREPWLEAGGLVVLVVSTIWTVRARTALGALWASGALTQEGHHLITDGPYAVTRHPIYTGVLGLLLGTALAQGLGRWAALAVLVAVLLVAKIRAEEALLARAFPDELARYRRDVPALLPRPARLGRARVPS